MSEYFEIKDSGLTELIKAFTKESPSVKVGILGGKNARKDQLSNATIGLKHEFGKDGMPVRSFLRMPIMEKLQKALDDSGAFSPESVKQIIHEKSLYIWVKQIGIEAVGVVLDAFETGGFGKWKPSNMERKKVKQTLVESQQLRNSIDSEVI